jgi:plastocyanin
MALSLAVAAVVWRFGRWTLLLSALYGLPPLIVSVALLSLAVIYPDSFLEFVPLLLVMGIGSLMSLVAGTRAFASYRRGHAAPVFPKTARWWLRTAAVAVVALSTASAVLAFAGRSTVAPDASVGAADITLRSLKIEPGTVEVDAGETVRLLVRNDDWSLHTFTIAGLDVDYTMRPRSSRLIEFTPTEAGEYRYFCRVLGHGAMEGTLFVE